jgi:hypothetical protein|tara:strand:+ start:1632 stop:1901 length:270 start_codon:yes stop_codon:yes gene_type:complete
MSKRLDALNPIKYEKDGQEKTQWNKVGVAFEGRNGGWNVSLNAMPAPSVDNKGNLVYKIVLMEPKSFDDERPARQQRPQQGGPDSEIPY